MVPSKGTPIRGMVGMFPGDDPCFGDFQFDSVPIYATSRSDWPPLSVERKNDLSLLHLVPEIFGLQFGLMFHQNVLFNSFKAFRINFLLDFQPNGPPFTFILDLLTPHFYKSLDPIGSNILSLAESG